MSLLLFGSADAQPRMMWAHNYHPGETVRDFFVTAAGDYAMCGEAYAQGQQDFDAWFGIADPVNGESLVGVTFRSPDVAEHAMTLIETDNGDFFLGGYTTAGTHDFVGWRLDTQGGQIWRRVYDRDGNYDYCYAVIELKDGNFLMTGQSSGSGRLLKITADGDVIWDRLYGADAVPDVFYSMREIEEGVLLAGRTGRRGWLLWVDEDGEPFRDRTYTGEGAQPGYDPSLVFFSLISCRDGGFMAAGKYDLGVRADVGWYTRVNQDGDLLWDAMAGTPEEENNAELVGVAQTEEGSFVSVGWYGQVTGGLIHSVDHSGNFLWERHMARQGNLPTAIWFTTVLVQDDDKFLIGGWGTAPDTMGGRDDPGSLMIKYELERDAPKIVFTSPPPPEVDSLRLDTTHFLVQAVDLQNDPINYLWVLDGDSVGTDTIYDALFEELGEHQLKCIVSDDEPADSVAWSIAIREVLILDQSPDSSQLTVRRGLTERFEIIAEAAEGQAPAYSWELYDLTRNSNETLSDADTVDVTFSLMGAYRLVGRAFVVGAVDSVVWGIEVKSTIRDFWPSNFYFELEAPTTVQFGVEPFNPLSDSLVCEWRFDDEMISDSLGIELTFADSGVYSVSCSLMDGEEADTLLWLISVSEPSSVDLNPHFPGAFRMSASPNPFNSTTRISYSIPTTADVRLSLIEIRGREVMALINRKQTIGEYSVIIDGSLLPAGIYFARLETGKMQQTVKIALVR